MIDIREVTKSQPKGDDEIEFSDRIVSRNK